VSFYVVIKKQFGEEFRLVLNQSVVPVDLELSPEEQRVFSLFAI